LNVGPYGNIYAHELDTVSQHVNVLQPRIETGAELQCHPGWA
jgi:hypothetical protein